MAVRSGLADGAEAGRLRAIESELTVLEVAVQEADLDLRIARGEVEEAWYRVEHARREGGDGAAEKAVLDSLMAVVEEETRRFAGVQEQFDDTKSRESAIRRREVELVDEERRFLKKLDGIRQRLDSVSMELGPLGRFAAIPTIEQFVLKGLDRDNFENWVDRVDRCTNCHRAIDRAGFEDEEPPFNTHPKREYYLGLHEPRRFGCTPCHGGQGASINSVEQAHGKIAFWEDPLLELSGDIQGRCLTCHRSARGLEGAEIAARGERLFEETGCAGCHLVEGFEELAEIGPSLERLAAKVEPEWLVAWLRDPREFRPRTLMPDFRLSPEESVAVSAYLIDASLTASLRWLEQSENPQGVDPNDAELASSGRDIAEKLGCLGCHGFAEGEYASETAAGKDAAPNLSRVAEKTDDLWLYNWLRDPRGYSETARMPSLRLEGGETAAITSYLMGSRSGPNLPVDEALRLDLAREENIAEGARLIRLYGCYGCHVIPGMEKESRVSVELSAFGDKPLEELFFGERTDIAATWRDWTVNKMLNPRLYATERIAQNMPDLGFDAADADALTVFLASRTERQVHPDYLAGNEDRAAGLLRGRRLLSRYNCSGCHSVDGYEGDIRRHYEAMTDVEDAIELAPPTLEGEGSKVLGDWLFDFLMKPVRLRPWLDVRMPSFGLSSDEASAMVDFFAALEGYELGPVILEADEDAGPVAVPVHSGLPEGVFDCYACHVEDLAGPASDQYAVSAAGLPRERASQWIAENLEIAADPALSEAERLKALERYLESDAD